MQMLNRGAASVGEGENCRQGPNKYAKNEHSVHFAAECQKKQTDRARLTKSMNELTTQKERCAKTAQ